MTQKLMSYNLLRTLLPSIFCIALLTNQSQAAINISVSAEKLKDPGGYDMAVTGILVLVADANGDGFAGPTASAFVQADDVVVAVWDIETGGGNAPGAFSGTTGSVSLGGDWDAGDPLAIYWFPTLVAANPIENTTPVAAIPYGMFRVTTGNPDNTDDWVTPEDGTIGHNLFFITTNATVLDPDGGSSDPEDGIAGEFTPGTGPLAPSNVAGAAQGPNVNVTWTNNATDATGYRVERSVAGSNAWSILATTAAGVSMYQDTTAAGGTTYLYRVLALRGPSQSAYAESDEVAGPALSARFANLSNRALVGVGDEVLIGSFILSGAPLRVYARVGGPAISNSVANFLADPQLELYRIVGGGQPNVLVAENDSWKSDQQALIESTTIQPANDVEPALVATLEPGTYSVVVKGVGDTTGFANVEIYEFRDPGETTHGLLTNLSNRALVGVGDEVLIGSVIITGDAPQRIYARVGGPAISNSVANFLADPTMELFKIVGGGQPNELIAQNDSWKSDQEALILSTTIQPANDVEPAIVATLDPGTYSIVVKGVTDTTGFANVELYNFPE